MVWDCIGVHICSTESCITLFQEMDCKTLAKLTPHTDKHRFTIYINHPILSLWWSILRGVGPRWLARVKAL